MDSVAVADRSSDRAASARLALAAASIVAGLIHAVVAPQHLAGSTILGAAFVATATFQVAWAAPLSLQPSRRVLDIGSAVNGAVLVAWIASRTVGLPFGPHAWIAEPVGALDAAAAVFELVIVIGSVLIRVTEPDRG
jgi:hypothetical protein